jgi:hypothetical protein
MFDSCTTREEAFRLYYSLIGNTSQEVQEVLAKFLQEAVATIDPEYEWKFQGVPTAYDIFLDMTSSSSNVVLALHDLEGYPDTTMEFTPWDPQTPIDDTQQYPEDEVAVRKSLAPAIPCIIPFREDTEQCDFYQGNVNGIVSEDILENSVYDISKPINDTDQFPGDENVPTESRQ